MRFSYHGRNWDHVIYPLRFTIEWDIPRTHYADQSESHRYDFLPCLRLEPRACRWTLAWRSFMFGPHKPPEVLSSAIITAYMHYGNTIKELFDSAENLLNIERPYSFLSVSLYTRGLPGTSLAPPCYAQWPGSLSTVSAMLCCQSLVKYATII